MNMQGHPPLSRSFFGFLIVIFVSGVLAACSGSVDSNTAKPATTPAATYRVTGTAAYGRPVVSRTVQAVDSTGRLCAQATTSSNGSYTMDTSRCAAGAAAFSVEGYTIPSGVSLMAVAVPVQGTPVINGVVNIDPLTTLIAYASAGMVTSTPAPATAAQALALLSKVTSAQYQRARSDVLTASLLLLLQNTYGVQTSGFSAGATSFAADGQGIDAFFDAYPLTAPTSASVQIAPASGAGLSVRVSLPTTPTTGSTGSGGSTVTSNVSFTVGGQVSGLSGGPMTLLLNGANALVVPANGAFRFSTPIASAYTVSVGSQPAGQTCSVGQGTGVAATANITNVVVSCSANSYTVGANVSGLAGGAQVVLQNNGGDATTVSSNGNVTFAGRIAYNGSYNVSVATQPSGQTCTVSNGSASGVSANVTNVNVVCAIETYTISGSVTDLSGTLVLQNNGADSTTIASNGSFSFATPVAYGGNYNVTVGTQPTNQTCTVTNGSAGGVTANVSNVAVQCVVTSRPIYMYVPDYNNGQILGYTIDTVTGAQSTIPGSPFAAGAQDRWITVDASGTYAFVPSESANTLSVYGINHSTGALTQLPGSPYPVGATPNSVTVNPAGTLVFIPNANSNTVSVFSINRSTGALTPVPGSPFATDSVPTKVAINPAGTFAFVADQNGTAISVYSIDASTGALTPVAGSPFSNGGNQPMGITTDPSGTHVYATNAQGNVTGFSIDQSTGVLTAIAGSPFAMGYAYQDGASMNTAFNASGTLAFVATGQDGAVLSYSVDATSGALTQIAGDIDTVGGGGAVFVTLDPTGTLLFEANFIHITVGIKQINQTTGALTDIPGSPFGVGARPYDIAIVQP
ncbi:MULTISPECIES: beta-propeller fold lactonase family protein [Paraburkholderia]|nr:MULTISPECIES: beta-propeller fold lactonase family protein [Paraburkholderia]MDR8395749.1 lactonase family protein [Paraburkholderia sp. USG1]